MTDEPKNNEPIKLESENVFDPDLRERDAADPGFLPGVDDPMLTQYSKFLSRMEGMLRSPMAAGFDRPKFEHQVRIYKLDDSMIRAEICTEIEALLNDGYHCQFPAVICNQYAMLQFSRRKEEEEHAPHTPAN